MITKDRPSLRAAILTISDSAFAGQREDRAGPAVAARLRAEGWEVVIQEILPDDRDLIACRLQQLADEKRADVVFTTGGTGLGPRDVTPEATRAVMEREIPGLAEHARAEGARRTRFALLSRGLAGTRGETLIVNLPGSPRGAIEWLDAILDVVPHIVDLLAGRTAHADEGQAS